jgi:outer membrane protein OmpU
VDCLDLLAFSRLLLYLITVQRKILFATTALVATASVAAADVTFSGYGRFGAVYTGSTEAGTAAAADVAALAAANAALIAATTVADLEAAIADGLAAAEAIAAATTASDSSVDLASRFRLQADVSTETDSGIGFNARMRIQVEENATNESNGIRFGMTTGGLAVNVGNINGVIESTPNLYMSTNSFGVGLEGNGFHSLATNNANGSWGWTAYSSGGAGASNGVEVIYSMGAGKVHVHSTDDDMAVGASYSMGGVTVAAAYEEKDNADDDNITLVTVGGECPSSYKVGHQIGLSTGGSGSFV